MTKAEKKAIALKWIEENLINFSDYAKAVDKTPVMVYEYEKLGDFEVVTVCKQKCIIKDEETMKKHSQKRMSPRKKNKQL